MKKEVKSSNEKKNARGYIPKSILGLRNEPMQKRAIAAALANLKSVFIFVLFLLVLTSFVIADAWTASQPSHQTLYTDTITSKTDASWVTVADSQGFEATGNTYLASAGGNVGIGTMGPDAKFTVLSSADGARTPWGGIKIQASDFATNGGYIHINRDSGSASFATIQVGDSMTSRALALQPDGGNVGIGTTEPQANLEVDGSEGIIVNRNSADAYGAPIKLYKSRGTDTSAQDGDEVSYIIARFLNDGIPKTWEEAAAIKSHVDDITDGTEDGRLEFYTREDGTEYERVRITNDGNVGIGTESPSNKLHVQGTGGGAAGIYLNDAVPSDPSMTLYNNGGDLYWNGANINSGSSLWSVSGSNIYRAGGNVGIGTLNPSQKLDISGNALLNTTRPELQLLTSGTGKGRVAQYAEGAVYLSSNLFYSGSSWNRDNTGLAGSVVDISDVIPFRLRYAASGANPASLATLMIVDPTGNVGIGTGSTMGKLDVNGTTVLRGTLSFGTDNSYNLGSSGAMRPRTGFFGTSLQSGLAMDADVSNFFGTPRGYFAADASTNMPVVIVGTGNNVYGAEIIGLKTRATSTNANTVVQNNDELMAILPYGSDGASYRQAAGITFYVDGTPGSSDMPGRIDFETSLDGTNIPLTRMTIKNDGNVGIGDLTPDYKLDVWGTICQDTNSDDTCDGTVTSDIRLKKNVATLDNALGIVQKLRGVRFEFNNSMPAAAHLGKGPQIGFIAQEVEPVLPELIYNDTEGYKMIDYQKISVVTIEAIKELKAENDALKQRILALEKRG